MFRLHQIQPLHSPVWTAHLLQLLFDRQKSQNFVPLGSRRSVGEIRDTTNSIALIWEEQLTLTNTYCPTADHPNGPLKHCSWVERLHIEHNLQRWVLLGVAVRCHDTMFQLRLLTSTERSLRKPSCQRKTDICHISVSEFGENGRIHRER